MLLEILAAAAVAGEPVPVRGVPVDGVPIDAIPADAVPVDAVPITPAPVAPAAITVAGPVKPMMVALSFVVDQAGRTSQCQFYSGPIPADGKPAMQVGTFCPPNFDYPYYDANGRPVARRVTISRTEQLEDAP